MDGDQHGKNGSWYSVNAVEALKDLNEEQGKRMWDAIKRLEDMSALRSQSQDKALALQASEYERRLSDLNHAHVQAVEAQRATVPREMFDNYRNEAGKWEREVRDKFAELKGASEQAKFAQQAQTKQLTVGLAILSILIGVAMRFIGQ